MSVSRRLFPTVFVSILLGCAALGGEGAVEINQACAVNTGCMPGDSAGFPVIIGTRGNYVLTGNLVVSDENDDGIYVTASGVTIDLNGFSIVGPYFTPGNGDGVFVQSGNTATTVKNGKVFGASRDGLRLQENGRVERVQVEANGWSGIVVGERSIVRNCTSHDNLSAGISAGAGSLIAGNTATSNGNNGISAIIASTITGNVSRDNGGVGIQAGNGGMVIDNTVSDSTGVGIMFLGGGGYAGNVLTDNNGSSLNPQVSGGTEIGTNLCGINTTCP